MGHPNFHRGSANARLADVFDDVIVHEFSPSENNDFPVNGKPLALATIAGNDEQRPISLLSLDEKSFPLQVMPGNGDLRDHGSFPRLIGFRRKL
jgi:hypothetical protein